MIDNTETFNINIGDSESKSLDQLVAELKAGFSVRFKQLVKDMLKYESKHDFESKVNLCRYSLYIAEEFESKDVLEKYKLIFQSIVYAIAWTNGWISD